MKKLLLLGMLLFAISGFSQKSKLIASCCEGKESKTFGRCTGSASCTACTNCKYCKYCNSGGSCGVCAPSSSYTSPTRAKKKTIRKSYSTSSTQTYYKSPSEYTADSYLTVTSETLNLREDAGTNYDIVETLVKGDLLKFISYEGDWIKVEVEESGNTGYVYYKFVN